MKFKRLGIGKDNSHYVFVWDAGNNNPMSLGDFASLKEGTEVLFDQAEAKDYHPGLSQVLGEFRYIAEQHNWDYEVLHGKYP